MSNLELTRAERLDQYVVRQLPDMSRAMSAKLIERGEVTVNGQPQYKAGYKVRATDQIAITYVAEDETRIPDIELSVLYEDDDCVIINKPVGLLTHSKGAFNPEPTVASWLRSHLANGNEPADALQINDRVGIVHRLDRATSGVMICAKTPSALSWLQKQFAQRRTKKTYMAIIEGQLNPRQAIIDMPIERNPKKPQLFRVGSNGKAAVTAYNSLDVTEKYSLVELKPTTGRTHQLRVHLEHQGHPILGDTFYGGSAADRLFLHAFSLELTLPNRQRKTFTVPTPKDFGDLLK